MAEAGDACVDVAAYRHKRAATPSHLPIGGGGAEG